MMKSKIICTIGPSTNSFDMLKRLAKTGMDCARLNFSHGSKEGHAKTIKMIRDVSKEIGEEIAIMQDLPGPKIRVGKVKNNSIHLRKDSIVRLVNRDVIGNENIIPITNKELYKFINPNNMIFLADGTIRLRVEEIKDEEIIAKVEVGGELISGKGVNIPDLKHGFNTFTDKDREYLEFGLENDIDLVALSFIREADDIRRVRKIASDIAIVSKIEKREAVNNIEDIIKVSDAVIIARGDLGIEMPLENVPLIQRDIIKRCNRFGIPVITATQILESMINNPRPTRAEVTDIAEAILNGTDGLLLSEETAIGKYPVECVSILKRVGEVTEESLKRNEDVLLDDIEKAVSKGIEQIASDINAKLIVLSSLDLANNVSRFRPKIPIILLTNNPKVHRIAKISWGVCPITISKDHIDMVNDSMSVLIDKYVKIDDPIIIAYQNDGLFICITKCNIKK
ncbi:MAG: pyruvate kinase [Candidatus Nitrosothermus koennekii]|nr:MAG: pyruvate kinase [Candidatus Nitrosothermus koennekii]